MIERGHYSRKVVAVWWWLWYLLDHGAIIWPLTSSTMTSIKCYSHLLWLTVLSCPPLPTSTIFHHLNVFLKSQVTASLTQPSPPHPIPPSPLPLSLLSNYIQHYTGGSWVRRQTRSSGEWCKSCSGPFTISSLSWSSSSCSTPTAAACLVSACHVCLLDHFPYLFCLFPSSSSVGTGLLGWFGLWG